LPTTSASRPATMSRPSRTSNPGRDHHVLERPATMGRRVLRGQLALDACETVSAPWSPPEVMVDASSSEAYFSASIDAAIPTTPPSSDTQSPAFVDAPAATLSARCTPQT